MPGSSQVAGRPTCLHGAITALWRKHVVPEVARGRQPDADFSMLWQDKVPGAKCDVAPKRVEHTSRALRVGSWWSARS